MSDITRKANVDAKQSVRRLIEASAGLSLRELAALCRRSAKRHELSFERRELLDDYGRTYDAVAQHEYLAWEQYYRRTYRSEES
jgi:hypothetical protein